MRCGRRPTSLLIGLLISALSGCGDNVYIPYGPHRHYVVDSLQVPTDSNEVRAYAVYDGGSGHPLNGFGWFLVALSRGVPPYFPGFGIQAIQAPNGDAVDRGTLITLVDIQAADLAASSENAATGAAGFSIYQGANASPAPCDGPTDMVCRHHLGGTGTFDVAATSAIDLSLVGAMIDGAFTGGPGKLTIQLMMGTSVMDLPLVGARTMVTGVSDAGITSGVVGGMITQETIDGVVAPTFQSGLVEPALARDCCGTPTSPQPTCDPNSVPVCGCTDGSVGQSLISFFDGDIFTGGIPSPKDCFVSIDEITSNVYFRNVTGPDFVIDGTQAISFGLHFSAVAGSFASP